jgi:hypothetical protein
LISGSPEYETDVLWIMKFAAIFIWFQCFSVLSTDTYESGISELKKFLAHFTPIACTELGLGYKRV